MDKKELLLNIWKSVGLRAAGLDRELSRDELATKLKSANPVSLRKDLEDAIHKQVQDDNKSVDKTFLREVSYDMNVGVHLLTNVVESVANKNGTRASLTKDQCLEIFTSIVSDTTMAMDTIIVGITNGLSSQKGMTEKNALEITKDLMRISQQDYIDYLKINNKKTSDISFNEYRLIQHQYKIKQKLAFLLGGNVQEAEALLAQKVDMNDPILKNEALRESYIKARCKSENDEIKVIDLFMMMSKSATNAQVSAFYKNRVIEQSKVDEKGNVLSATDSTKIDNIIGREGKKVTEQLIGKPLTKKLQPATSAVNAAELPDHSWRGFEKLAKLITETVKAMYSSIQVTGFVEKLIGANKKKEQEIVNYTEFSWDVKCPEVPKCFISYDANGNKTENNAVRFWEDTQVRIINDKNTCAELSAFIENARTSRNLTDEHINKIILDDKKRMAKQAAQPTQPAANQAKTSTPQTKSEDEILAEKFMLYDYYDARVTEAERICAESVKYIDTNPRAVDNENLFEEYKERILNLDDKNSENNKFWTADEKIQTLIAKDRNIDAKQNIIHSLQKFSAFNSSTNETEKNASYDILTNLLGLDKDTISKEELEALMAAPNRGNFNPTVVNDTIQKLQSGQITVEQCRRGLHDSSVRFLQDKHIEDYYAYVFSNEAVASQTRTI